MKVCLDFGRRLRECRKTKRLSQFELAKLSGASCSIIGKYERDEITPSVGIAKNLAIILGTTVSFLVGENNLYEDPRMVKFVKDIKSVSEADQTMILYTVNAMIRSAKISEYVSSQSNTDIWKEVTIVKDSERSSPK